MKLASQVSHPLNNCVRDDYTSTTFIYRVRMLPRRCVFVRILKDIDILVLV